MELEGDHVTERRRLDITVIDNDNKTALLIDIVVPREAIINEKKQQNVDKCQDLAKELRRLWQAETKAVPIVAGIITVAKWSTEKLKESGNKSVTHSSEINQSINQSINSLITEM